MSQPWRSLRVQLALLAFLAIYLPVLAMLAVSDVAESTVNIDGLEVTERVSTERSPWLTVTAAVLAPAAAGLAWWLAGRAVRPIDQVRSVAEDIEGSALSRRIGLQRGPTEVVALAASFDAMLDRLERSATTQRRLVEETSHELRTPLSVLVTNADVLLAHPQPTVDLYRSGIERSRSAAHRLQATIDELLVDARGRARTIDRLPADLSAITRAVVDDAQLIARQRDITLSLRGPSAAECALDETTVRRALTNLVDNAVRFAPAGSTVDVALELTEAEAVVVVTDHGPGIPANEQEHVFDRFWSRGPDIANDDTTGTGTGTGTGLGLPIAKQIAIAHGGDLTMSSPGPDGDGCALRLRLRR